MTFTTTYTAGQVIAKDAAEPVPLSVVALHATGSGFKSRDFYPKVKEEIEVINILVRSCFVDFCQEGIASDTPAGGEKRSDRTHAVAQNLKVLLNSWDGNIGGNWECQ